MGREIRRVPPNWEHPKNKEGRYQPAYDKNYDEEATWYQVYETVSEGTPVTPPFATQQELVDYLVEHGDRHQQTGYSREAAEKFVFQDGWCPSMTFSNGVIKKSIETVID